jgi:hypothetical protein
VTTADGNVAHDKPNVTAGEVNMTAGEPNVNRPGSPETVANPMWTA